MAGLAGGEETPHLYDLSPALLNFAGEQVQELAERGIRERASELAIFEQSIRG
jgi:hypothetical protein